MLSGAGNDISQLNFKASSRKHNVSSASCNDKAAYKVDKPNYDNYYNSSYSGNIINNYRKLTIANKKMMKANVISKLRELALQLRRGREWRPRVERFWNQIYFIVKMLNKMYITTFKFL